MQRVVVIKERDSYLLYGDSEEEDDRLFSIDGLGQIHGSALPILVSEGWKIKSITSMGDSAVVLLQMGEGKTNAEQERGD